MEESQAFRFSSNMSPQHCLVAGATGRPVSAVIAALLKHLGLTIAPSDIWAITRNTSGASAQALFSRYPGLNIVTGDLANADALFEQMDHTLLTETAAFLAHTHGPTELDDVKEFIDAAFSHKITYFVYSSVDRGGRELSDKDPSYCKTFPYKFYVEKHLKYFTGRGKGWNTRLCG